LVLFFNIYLLLTFAIYGIGGCGNLCLIILTRTLALRGLYRLVCTLLFIHFSYIFTLDDLIK